MNAENIWLGGWIDVNEALPILVNGKNYSENVWGWDGHSVLVVATFIDSDGFFWAGCNNGSVFSDALFDDDYDIKCWQPIFIPRPPEHF